MPPQCQQYIKTAKTLDRKTLKTKDESPALTLKNLTGAFIVLLLGFSFSFLTFFCELIISIPNRHSRRLQKAGTNSANTAENTQINPAVNTEVENNSLEKNAVNRFIKRNQIEPTVSKEDEFEIESIQMSQNLIGSEIKMIAVDIYDQNQHHDVQFS